MTEKAQTECPPAGLAVPLKVKLSFPATARILLLGAQNPLRTEELKWLEMMRTQRRGACSLNRAPRPDRASWPACSAVKTCQKADDLQLFQTETHRNRIKGKATVKNSMRSGEHSKLLVKKPFEILCLSQKRKFLFGDKSMCHRYHARCYF